MNIQSFEKMIKQLQEMVNRLTGQKQQWEECRQYCPIEPERPVRRQTRAPRYYQ